MILFIYKEGDYMAFNDRLKEARLNSGMTQEQVSEKIGVAKSTLTGYEKGNREPNMLTIQKLMDVLSVDANFLWQDEMKDTSEMIVSSDEWDHIRKYRKLDVYGKKSINTLLQNEYDRVTEQYMQIEEPSSQYVYTKTEYLTGLSAGTGLFVFDDIPTQVINVPEKYKDADFVIGVSGDSMEPTFSNGDKVAVIKKPCLNKGDIGVFMVNGNGYIKEYGDGILISHNKIYNNISVDETTICIGKVLGKL